MKKTFSVLAAVTMMAVSAHAQDTVRASKGARIRGGEISAPVTRREEQPTVTPDETVQGVIPKAVRMGDGYQMLNPLAPRKYGNGSQFVNSYADGPGQGPKNQKNYATAFKLFAFEF